MNKRKVRGKDKFLVWWKGFIVEGNTWESRENLENVGDLLREFEKEYRRDHREVRQQEQVDDIEDYYRGELPGQYIARKLFGWLYGEYNCQYWQRLERNWKWWKSINPAGEVKGRLTAVCEVVEEEVKIKEWVEEDEMGKMGNNSNEL